MTNLTHIPMLNAARLHRVLADELSAVFNEVLASGTFIGGKKVEKFETELAQYLQVNRAVGVNSGTDALLATMIALDVKPGDEIITTPYTFFAVAGVISRLGAIPVFADIDLESFNIKPSNIENKITKKTVGILPVHLFGLCADIDKIISIADSSNLWVIEDTAQSIGAKLNGRCAGTIGNAGALSFFPAKNLGALGDAGAILTNDNTLADRLLALRNHGAVKKYRHEYVGGNFRLDAMQAAFLSVKLPKLDTWQKARQNLAKRYRESFRDLENLIPPKEYEPSRHVYNQFVIRVKNRDKLKHQLEQVGIDTAVYYPYPLHLQPCFSFLGYKEGDFQNAEKAAKETLALPMDPLMTEEEQQRIITAVQRFVKRDDFKRDDS